jgi:hypothetical protein
MALLKFKPKTESPSPFEKLVGERVSVGQELCALESQRGFKLTAKAFLKEALAFAHADEKTLAAFRATLESASDLERTKSALRRMVTFAKSPSCSRPTSELRRLDFLLRPEVAEVCQELASVRATTFLLFALAVQLAGEQSPESFGTAESSRAWDEVWREARDRCTTLNGQIEATFTQDDLDEGEIDPQGRVRPTFRISGGKVAAYPRKGAAERLAAFLISTSA